MQVKEDAAQLRADQDALRHLDRRHQRQGQRDGPEHRQPELSARLRVGRNTAGVVIRGPDHETRPETARGSHERERAAPDERRWFHGLSVPM
ncbi:MAG: hypothetical protein IT514_11315 [Burkholderiales bacterium]|nr:hypothetical protein [Burkholderiales bacterium]